MSIPIKFEVCVGSVEGAIAAQAGGADRVELCADLLEGGITPSAATIELTRRHIDIDMNVIIRPRGGDFLYSETEFEVMKRDVELAKQWGGNGVVIGLLTEDGAVDVDRTGRLVELARPMSVTYHRAFDMCRDPYEALDDLISLGVDRVLTSGQEVSVLEGLDLISELIRMAQDRIIIMPGGGITERNIKKVVARSGAREIHFGAGMVVESQMKHRNARCYMGGAFRPPEYSMSITSPDRVGALMRSATED